MALVFVKYVKRTEYSAPSSHITPRDMLFGSDGDWGGIYILRALFSPIPVDF